MGGVFHIYLFIYLFGLQAISSSADYGLEFPFYQGQCVGIYFTTLTTAFLSACVVNMVFLSFPFLFDTT